MSGGEVAAWERLRSLAQSGALSAYKDTRNGLVGTDYSTKLSSYLAMGCLTARQIHEELLSLENGTNELYKDAKGYGEGENEGTKGIRFELLWRDYMRLCTAKFGRKLFRLSGFRQDDSYDKKWKTPNKTTAAHNQDPGPEQMAKLLERFETGTTGMGLIDASQRELLLTGYTSNRARQNVASFLSKHLGIDWRFGAEWYEMLLVDYDVSSNWANWQYVAGVGNDPRGDARTFNPVKQAFDYDKDGSFVRMWLPELREIQKLENLFQVWTTDQEELEKCGLLDNVMVTDPVKRIEFNVDRKPKTNRRPFIKRGRGQQRGGRWGNNQYASGHGSGASSEATASDTAAPTSGNDDSHYTTNSGSNWRSSRSNASSPPQGGRGWHNSDPSRGRGFTQNRGYWRPPTGARGDYTGNYQGFPPPHIPRQ